MSDDSSAGGGDQPPAKKLKRSDDDEDETTTEKFGGPIEDEATALQKLEQAGIDPDLLQIEYDVEVTDSITWIQTPMEYFCRVGDLPMCRYLLSKGVATTGGREDDDEYEYWFPMLAAASRRMQVAVPVRCPRGSGRHQHPGSKSSDVGLPT